MNAESVVSIITGEESDSNWNDLEEEQEDYFEEESLRVNRLMMKLGKMSDIRGSVFYFISLCLDDDDGQDGEKDNGDDDGKEDGDDDEKDGSNDDGKDDRVDFDDCLHGPSGLGTVSGDNSGTLDGPVDLCSNSFLSSHSYSFSTSRSLCPYTPSLSSFTSLSC